MKKLITIRSIWLAFGAVLIAHTAAPAFANTITIASPTLSSTEITAAATSVTVSAAVSDSNPSDGSADIYALWSPNYQADTETPMTSSAPGGAQSATFNVPFNPLVQRVAWTVTIVAEYGSNSLTKQLTLVQDSAGPPTITETVTTTAGDEVEELDPAGQSIEVQAIVDSPVPVSKVTAQLTSPPAQPTTITLAADPTGLANEYTGALEVPVDDLQQTVPWTVTVIATAGNNVGTAATTINQNPGDSPVVSDVVPVYVTTPDDNGNNLEVSADVTSSIPLSQVVAYVRQDTAKSQLAAGPTDGYVDTITLTKSTGNSYTGAAAIAANMTNAVEGWTVTVVAIAGNLQAADTATFNQAVQPNPQITAATLSPASSEGDVGGTLDVSLTIPGLSSDAIVTAYFVDNDSDHITQLEGQPDSKYTGSVSLSPNQSGTPDKWTMTVGVQDGSYEYGSVQGSFSQPGSGTASPGGAPEISTGLTENSFAASGETVDLDVSTTTAESPNEDHESRISILAFANGIPQPTVDVFDNEATDGDFTEKVGVPENFTGITQNWTFQVSVTDAYGNQAVTTVGPVGQPYATPVLANATLDPADFEAGGVNADVNVSVTADESFNAGSVLFFANGVPMGAANLLLTSPDTEEYSTGTWAAAYGIPANNTGAAITWTAQIVDSQDQVGNSTVNLGPVTQPFLLTVDTAAASPAVGTGGAFEYNGDTAKLTVDANADGDFVVEVDSYANGVYQSTAQLQNTAGVFNGNGAYNGTLTIPANTSGVEQEWTFVFTAVDAGGNFATTTVGPVKQPYQLPTLVGAAVAPANVIVNAGAGAALSVTATSADGVNNITAYAFANGIYDGSAQLLNAGANQPNGLFKGVYQIPVLMGQPIIWTFAIVDIDSGGNLVWAITAPVSQGPAILALVPNSAKAVTAINPLTVNGVNFDNTSVVDWNGIALTTTFVNTTSLTAVVPASVNGLLPGDTYPGNVPITVTTSAGFVTPAVQFMVKEPVPTVTSLLPSQAFATGAAFNMTVTGTNFGTGATVMWTVGPAAPIALATTFVDNTTLTAAVPATLIGTIGIAAVSVTQAGGTPSAAPPQLFDIIIKPLAPTITSIAPKDGPGGSTVTITGSNFSGSGFTTTAVSFNGVAAKFSDTSATSIAATVPAEAATGPVTVTTPGGTSNAVSFTVTIGHAFLAGLAMISVPTDYTGQSLSAVLGYTSPALAVWDPSVGTYDVTPAGLAAALKIGHGYWVRFPTAEAITTLGTPTPTRGPLVITLSQGWNMIGDPFPADVPISSILVTVAGSAPQSFAAAVSSGLVSGSLFTYQAGDTGYETVASASNSLVPYEGYWVFVSSACTIGIPPP